MHCFMFQPLSLSCVPVTETELLHRSPSRATRVWIVFFFIIIIFLFCRECEKSFSSLSYFFFSLLPLCLQKKNKLQITTFFCTYACKLIKILEPSFGDWGGQGTVRRKKDEEKALHFSFFIRWSGCLQGYSCNIYKCCLHHWTTKKK